MSRIMLIPILVSAALFAAGALARSADDKPKDAEETPGPQVRILSGHRSVMENVRFLTFSCELANPHQESLKFVGYRSDSFDPPIAEGTVSPIYIIELQRDGKREEHPIGWCGTGMDGIQMAGKAKATFGFAIPADTPFDAIRVGVRWARELNFETAEDSDLSIAWSKPLERKEIEEVKKD